MDISGEQHLEVRHDIIKKRIDANGRVIETRADTIGAPKIDLPLQRHCGRLEVLNTMKPIAVHVMVQKCLMMIVVITVMKYVKHIERMAGHYQIRMDLIRTLQEIQLKFQSKKYAVKYLKITTYISAKEKDFCKRSRLKRGKAVTFMDSWMSKADSPDQQISIWRFLPWRCVSS